MLDNEKEAVLNVINSLWAHDAWNWGNTCAKLVNQEIDWDKPAILDIDGEYITANVYVKDGREFQIGYQEGGWFMCFIKDCDDPRARLTKPAPDAGDSAAFMSLVQADSESTSQTEPTPTQRG